MIKNTFICTCIIVIVACLIKIHTLNKIVDTKVIPYHQSKTAYHTICTRITNDTIINEFISYHMSQGFLSFILYGDGNYDSIKSIYSDFGLDIQFKSHVDNIEWDCILDSVFNPETSSVIVIDNDQFIFPLESKYDIMTHVDTCHILREYNFIRNDNDMITKTNERKGDNISVSNTAIIPIGKTSDIRVRLLRNYSMNILFDNCVISDKHGVANIQNNNDDIPDIILHDNRLRDMHHKVTLGRL